LLEAQKALAEQFLAGEIARAYCAPDYANAIGEFERQKIMNAMRRNGFTVTYIPVGYDVEDKP